MKPYAFTGGGAPAPYAMAGSNQKALSSDMAGGNRRGFYNSPLVNETVQWKDNLVWVLLSVRTIHGVGE